MGTGTAAIRSEGTIITGIHAMFYSSQAEELRAFLSDKLGLSSVDIGGGWLAFDLPGAEVGVHAVDLENGRLSGMYLFSFYCDDIEATVAELAPNGVEFVGGIRRSDWGSGHQVASRSIFTSRVMRTHPE